MRASIAYTLSRLVPAAILGTWVAVAAHAPASANVITDWDEKAVAFLQPRMVPPVAYRAMAIVHIAMFDAVNSIEPLYQPYYAQYQVMGEASKDAAAAAAAGAVLTQLLPDISSEIQAALRNYLSAIPESEAKSNGIKLGDAVAAKSARGARKRRIVDCGCLSARDHARRLYPDSAHGRAALARPRAVCDDEPIPVQAKTTDRA